MPSRRFDRVEGPFSGEMVRVLQDKGFGFARRTDQPGTNKPDEYFVHQSSMAAGEFELLVAGDRVRFMGKMTEKGLRAVDVTREGQDADDERTADAE